MAAAAAAERAERAAMSPDDDPVTRQMVDKRHSRRLNKKSFQAAIAAWSERRGRAPLSPIPPAGRKEGQTETDSRRASVGASLARAGGRARVRPPASETDAPTDRRATDRETKIEKGV